MFNWNCWKFVRAGKYFYKNGIMVEKIGKIWTVYIDREKEKTILFEGKTLRACKNYLMMR